MTQDLTEHALDGGDDTYDLPGDDDLDDEPVYDFVRHRNLMKGEAMPTIPTMYQQLVMTWRAGAWVVREELSDHQIFTCLVESSPG